MSLQQNHLYLPRPDQRTPGESALYVFLGAGTNRIYDSYRFTSFYSFSGVFWRSLISCFLYSHPDWPLDLDPPFSPVCFMTGMWREADKFITLAGLLERLEQCENPQAMVREIVRSVQDFASPGFTSKQYYPVVAGLNCRNCIYTK